MRSVSSCTRHIWSCEFQKTLNEFADLFFVQKAAQWLPILFRVKVQDFNRTCKALHDLSPTAFLSYLISHYFPCHCLLLSSPNTPGIKASPFKKLLPLLFSPPDIPRANYLTFSRFLPQWHFHYEAAYPNFNTRPQFPILPPLIFPLIT